MFNQFPYLVVSPMPTVYLRKKIYLSNTGKTKTLNSYDLINQNEILLVVKQDSTKVINQEVGLLRELFVAIGQRPRSRVCLVIGPKRCFYFSKDGQFKFSTEPPSGGHCFGGRL